MDKMGNGGAPTGNYLRFALMLGLSFVIMYSVMFSNVDRLDHIYLSVTRFYMTLLMIAPMALVMLGFMGGMYKNRRLNIVIVVVSAAVFAAALIGLRTQAFIGNRQFMKAMIPHHSSAILTSRKADLQGQETRKLAQEIIESQEREIEQMRQMLEEGK
jgi:hypothetical protein